MLPQLYADNLKCSSVSPRASFGAASLTVQYVWAVGQDVSPGKCVLLSTSKAVKKEHEAVGFYGEWEALVS